MKRLLLIPLVLVIAGMLVFGSCGEPEETTAPTTTAPTTTAPTTTAPTTTAPTTTAPTTAPTTTAPTTTAPTTAPTTPAPGGPEYGGTLRIVSNIVPNVIGYGPEKSPSDSYLMLPVIERLAEWGDTKGTMVGILAESWDIDPVGLTFTWNLRKGVKFHDGTDFNAEAVRWNFQLSIDASRLSDAAAIDSLEVVDDHTLRMNLNSYNWVMLENWGLMTPISPTAFENSGTTEEERIAWARANAVGTGPYTMESWQRDDHINFVKNPDYWREGMPYLDAIEMRRIPDPMVAAATIEAGEADMWIAVSQVQQILNLQNKGFQIVWGPGMFQLIALNSSDPESIFAIKEIREAIEYALDRPTIAGMIGQGLYEPLHQMASSTWPGYVEGYDPRPFNQDKARELLAQAGKPDGFKTTMMLMERDIDACSAIQAYLGEVGIDVELDVADPGRYFGSAFGTGWDDMIYAASGINPSTTDLYIHYGPSPVTFRTGNIWKSPEYLAKCEAALDPSFMTATEALPGIKEAIRQAGEDAMIVPLWRTAECSISQTYVHTDYPIIHGIIWTPYDDWMEEH